MHVFASHGLMSAVLIALLVAYVYADGENHLQ